MMDGSSYHYQCNDVTVERYNKKKKVVSADDDEYLTGNQ